MWLAGDPSAWSGELLCEGLEVWTAVVIAEPVLEFDGGELARRVIAQGVGQARMGWPARACEMV